MRDFRTAIEHFSEDVPELAGELRDILSEQYVKNEKFRRAAGEFLDLCRESINPSVEMADVREMIIQHVLTQDIFITVFDEPQFHLENNVAQKLGEVVGSFYSGATRRRIHDRIAPYYQAINARAAQIVNHHEKQKFLKVLYETFYKAYNPKAADRLGIVYTPGEIVRFMIEATDHLCWRHFGRGLASEGVQILDPATGTGTFITELIEYLPAHQLRRKYEREIHCNEVAILPYYIANLNIEYTYKQKMGEYVPFENIVFVDTLDNTGFTYEGKQFTLFGLAEENAERIRAQNELDMTVIIGNPPYNAWQENFNNQNANRAYREVDARIRQTYAKQGTAQNQIGLYDMYTRFLRWASDRLGETGVVAFITNNSFIDAFVYDGFRKVAGDEFSHIYVVDLGGNVRKNPKLSGPKHNVFAIQAGVAISFFVRNATKRESPARIFYARRPEMEQAKDKLHFLAITRFQDVDFKHILPNSRHSWINQGGDEFFELLPLVDKDVKAGRGNEAVFRLFSRGVATQRDEWVYDFSREALEAKMRFFVDVYEAARRDPNFENKGEIKWDADLVRYRERNVAKQFDESRIVRSLYRPFVKSWLYFDGNFNGRTYQLPSMFPSADADNLVIGVTDSGSEKPFMVMATDCVPDLHLVGAGASAQCLPLYRYDDDGTRRDNITDWALAQFRERYADGQSKIQNPQSKIARLDIFHYVYAVLHDPVYRETYKLNLKRDFPRVPFYADFWQWARWGERLLDLHLNYEEAAPYPLDRFDLDPDGVRKAYKARLKAQPADDAIEVDTLTTLDGVPPAAWRYRLGNRSALEWVLDRYKERTPRDPTIREKFNTYQFVDYKEPVIDLLRRVTSVSVETMAIIDAMTAEQVER